MTWWPRKTGHDDRRAPGCPGTCGPRSRRPGAACRARRRPGAAAGRRRRRTSRGLAPASWWAMHAELAVHQLALVVVARLDHAVADAQRRSRGSAAPSGLQPRAQLGVQRVDAERAAMHRGEHEDVARGIEVVVRRAGARRRATRPRRTSRRRSSRSTRKKSRTSSAPASVGGGSPALMACAARTISERAAWRKISVRRTVGTTPESIRSSSTRAGADGRRAGRRRRRAARACAARRRRAARRRAARDSIDASSTTSTSAPGDRVVRAALEALVGDPAEQAVDRRRLRARRLRQPPRGLAGRRAQPDAARRAPRTRSTSARIVAVLPVPGPPVRIARRPPRTASTTAHWSSVGTKSPRRRALAVVEAAATGSSVASARAWRASRRSRPSIAGSASRSPSATSRPRATSSSMRPSTSSPSSDGRARDQLLAREQAVPVALGLGEHVQHAGVQALGRVAGRSRARARARRRSRTRRRRPRSRSRGRARSSSIASGPNARSIRAAAAAVDAVLGEEQPQRAASAQLLPGAHGRRRSARARCRGPRAARARGSRVDDARARRSRAAPAARRRPTARRA